MTALATVTGRIWSWGSSCRLNGEDRLCYVTIAVPAPYRPGELDRFTVPISADQHDEFVRRSGFTDRDVTVTVELAPIPLAVLPDPKTRRCDPLYCNAATYTGRGCNLPAVPLALRWL